MARTKRAVDELLTEERCPPHLIDSLVSIGFERRDVENWQPVKVRAVLDKFKRDTAASVSRADGVAERNDGTSYPPPQAERDEAAGWLGQAMGKTDGHELRQAMTNAVYLLADDEALRLASHLIQRLKTRPKLPETASLFGRTLKKRTEGGSGDGAADDQGVIDL